jgi:hypothetical protein
MMSANPYNYWRNAFCKAPYFLGATNYYGDGKKINVGNQNLCPVSYERMIRESGERKRIW